MTTPTVSLGTVSSPAAASGGRPATGDPWIRSGPHQRRIYLNLSDQRAAALIRNEGSFNPHALAIWRTLVREGSWTHIIDIGANYGEMLIGVDLESGTKVTAVEPNPSILPYLERTLNEADVHATIVRSAVSETIGVGRLLIDNHWSGTTRLAKPGEIPSETHICAIDVQVTTLSALLQVADWGSSRVLVKIDVEGHEAKVLKGGLEAIERLACFKALIEIAHIDPDDRSWIFDQFDVFAFDLVEKRLARVTPHTSEGFSAMTSGARFFSYDVVISPRQPGLYRFATNLARRSWARLRHFASGGATYRRCI